jgi:hypothetical protein
MLNVVTPWWLIAIIATVRVPRLLPVLSNATVMNDLGAVLLLNDLPRRWWGRRQVFHSFVMVVHGIRNLDLNRNLNRDLDGDFDPALSLTVDGIRNRNDPLLLDVDLAGMVVITAVRAGAATATALLRLDVNADDFDVGLRLNDRRWWWRRRERKYDRRWWWWRGGLAGRLWLRLGGDVGGDAATDGGDIRIRRREIEAALGTAVLLCDW